MKMLKFIMEFLGGYRISKQSRSNGSVPFIAFLKFHLNLSEWHCIFAFWIGDGWHKGETAFAVSRKHNSIGEYSGKKLAQE